MQREEPYQDLTCHLSFWKKRVPSGLWTQVVHGCRQLVSWDVGLSPATSVTLVFSCHHLVGHFKKTAGDKSEEGEDDVKSACPLHPGLHTYYNGWDKELLTRKSVLISQTQSQFRLQAATRLHEVGIASNRRSAILRWIRSRALYTPPVTPWKLVIPKAVTLTLRRGAPKVGLVTGVKS